MPSSLHIARALALLLLVSGAMLASMPDASVGASSSVTVQAMVLSATSVDASACTAPASTDFGALQPSSTLITSGDCTVSFSSSNATARLRMLQRDGTGNAMVSFTDGTRATDLGGTGVATVALPGTGSPAQPQYMDRGPDGSMYFAGYDASRAMVTKVLPTGALDTSFGGGDGVVDVLAPGSTASFAYALEVQPDGSILMGGYATRANNDLLIVRFLADGSLDTSFGVGGYVVDSITSSTDLVYAITADVAGNVIVSGSYTNGPGFDGVVVRYLPNGTRDTTFGTNGFVATGTPAYDERFTQVEIDSTGRIVVSSTIADQTWSGTGATWRDMSVRRYLATGQPDAAFGTAGLVTLNRSALTDYVMGLTIDHLDRPVIVGYTNVSTSMRGVVARLRETDGALDPTFATGGWYDHDPTTYNDYLYDVHELDDGSIAAVGTTPPDGAQFSTGVLRLTTAGVLQSATVVDLLPTSENIRGSSLDGDGGLVVAGYTTTAPLVAVIGHLAGASFTDYGTAAANTWQGGAASLFGTCLRSLAGASVSAPWSIDGNAACTAFDTDPWRAVARQPSEVAATTVAGASATANFRFGLRTSASQKPGAYASMVTFNVVAP